MCLFANHTSSAQCPLLLCFESESHSVVSNSFRPHGLYSPWNSLGQNTGVGSLSLLQGIFPTQGSNSSLASPSLRGGSLPAEPPAAKSLQSCPTLCDPIDGSPPASPIPGILQARTLEWAANSFSNAWKWKVKVKSLSRVRYSVIPWTAAFQASLSMGFSSQEYHQTLFFSYLGLT